MLRIMTQEYQDKKFFIPYTQDKTEGFWVHPLKFSTREAIRREAALEAGMDMTLAAEFFALKVLKACVVDWKGAQDTEGNDIPFSEENLCKTWKYDPDMANDMLTRVLNVARCGGLDESGTL